MRTYPKRRIRASLSRPMILRGTDSAGRSFEVHGSTVDFSRRGLGLLVPREVAAPGSRVSVSFPDRFEADAVVEWVRPESGTGQDRIGVRILESRMGAWLRVAAAVLLCVAVIGEVSLARPRESAGRSQSCSMSLEKMRSALESRLGPWVALGDSEKAFLHVQHRQTNCEEYTKTYEKSQYFSDKHKRMAVERWHWRSYHSKDEAVREAAVHSAEAVLGN